jgi:chromatin remodeling complex protein RSC6
MNLETKEPVSVKLETEEPLTKILHKTMKLSNKQKKNERTVKYVNLLRKSIERYSNVIPKTSQKKLTFLLNNLEKVVPVVKLNSIPENENKYLQNKSYKVSEAVREFLNLKPDETATWPSLIIALNKYIKEKKLQDPVHKSRILVDETLDKVLRYNEFKHLLPLDTNETDVSVAPLTYQRIFKLVSGICFPELKNKLINISQ